MPQAGLSFVTLLAYDYRYAYDTIASYYAIADEIILGLDRDRLTWSRQPFAIDIEQVNRVIRGIDHAGRIRMVEGNFHSHDTPMENDTAERRELGRQCLDGNWVVQIDADEILLNPAEFKQFMTTADPTKDVGIGWATVFKTFGRQALVIQPQIEVAIAATMARDQYTVARASGREAVIAPVQALHFSWGRTRDEVKQKLANWSHAKDFDTDVFFHLWDSVTLENYTQIRDFHPMHKGMWQSLQLVTIDRT